MEPMGKKLLRILQEPRCLNYVTVRALGVVSYK